MIELKLTKSAQANLKNEAILEPVLQWQVTVNPGVLIV